MLSESVESWLNHPVTFPNSQFEQAQGVGMTSQRTRNRLVARLIEQGETNRQVLQAIQVTPRHRFLDEALASRAYEDTALPIGFGQTISQPKVVCQMSTWLFANGPLKRVLEVGTGSGYQTAILAQLAEQVYSVERIEPLFEKAQQVLRDLALRNIRFALSDGHWGWPEQAPFDGIISAASPETLPEALIDQLKVGGRLIMPIGGKQQVLFGFEKTANGLQQTCLGEVLFVPMKQGVQN